ncbi:phage baseplate assembly protein V [Clostridium sp. BL-8]|uniref:phage baseplate assembly protein V n=1 Tax=Clostridium sp. BL-8 TaxID=349938 RepID=UPI00098C7242|nr:phage baseplate assembly protein V [Clostridium sp. BL-8]OOM74738.1 phage late control protein Gpd [Clostridium sp. BL-8]
MSEEYVYGQGDIIVEPYKFQKLTKLKIINELNEHSKLRLSGIISDENADNYVENAEAEETINVSLKDDEGNTTVLFNGYVTKIGIKAQNDVRTLEVEALSKTFLMDIRKVSGSYQDTKLTYGDIFKQKNTSYDDLVMVDNITNGTKIDGLIVQYKETDWEFLKRIASYFNVALVPECRMTGIKYSIGGAGESVVYDIDEFNYSIEKGLQEYNKKTANEAYEINDLNLVSYEITTNKLMKLYNKVNFKGRTLLVYRDETELEGGVITSKYILRDENGMKVNRVYNDKMVGLSLQGRVLDTQKDKVKVSLEIDGSPTDKNSARWFEFSTIFSQPDGTGWYCMPEVEDVVRLYFPDNEEKHAYVISSMHYDGIDDSKRSDPSVKSISTKYGKEIVMSPGSVEIIGNGSLLMRMTDDGGIEVNSNKKIILDAKDDIEINGGAKVQIKGHKGISLTQSGASMIIKDDVTMSGGKVNVQE